MQIQNRTANSSFKTVSQTSDGASHLAKNFSTKPLKIQTAIFHRTALGSASDFKDLDGLAPAPCPMFVQYACMD
jgi:hypothetical protein